MSIKSCFKIWPQWIVPDIVNLLTSVSWDCRCHCDIVPTCPWRRRRFWGECKIRLNVRLTLSSRPTCRRDVWQWSCWWLSQSGPRPSMWRHSLRGPRPSPARLVVCNRKIFRYWQETFSLLFWILFYLGCSSKICWISNLFLPASCSRLCIQLVEAALKTGHQTRDFSYNETSHLLTLHVTPLTGRA